MNGWNWDAFKGSAAALKWNRRDLPCLDTVVGYTRGRTAVIQAGGNLGIYPKRLAESFATVYTFEPEADSFAMLMQNAPESNIVKFQASLGDARRLVGLRRTRRDGSSGPNHEGISYVCGDGVIPTLRIDDLGLPVCDLIYLDLEGYELFALRGGAETIARCRPVIALELDNKQTFFGHQPEWVRDYVKAMGYHFVERLRSDEVYLPAEWAQAVSA